MSYQVLARKWRPKKFNELMGQDHVVNVLVNALTQQRLHHAYLFTGTRGVGKTTIARIFAKSLNCQQGVSAEPCGKCDTCLDIDQGRFIDLLEIDAASRTKVDDTREILDNVQYAPSRGRYKVYLIDEVHMLSRSSFNALLKTLEEPPEHVKFILATTDPQKLPITVLSRCLQFHLKALTVSQIKQQLETILAAENVKVDEGSLSLLAKAARGSMRDGLSLTDQAIAQGAGSINMANLQQMLGGIDQHWPYKIIIALIKKDLKGLMELSLEIASYSPNYSRLLAELIQLLHQIAIAQVIDKSFDLSPEHNNLLHKFTQAMSPEDIQLYYQIALNGRKDLPYAIDEQAAFDMTLLRLSSFQPTTAESIVNQTASAASSVDFSEIELSSANISHTTDNAVSLPELLPEKKVVLQPLVQQADGIEKFSSEANHSLTQPINNIEQDEDHQQSFRDDRTIDFFDDIDQVDVVGQCEIDEGDGSDRSDREQYELAQNIVADNLSINTVSQVAQSAIKSTINNGETNKNTSPIEAILASRNMLRSKKKQLEQQVKKPEGAVDRQPLLTPTSTIENLPEIAEVHEQVYTPEIIDPATIRSANQVDKWANMIDHMALNGRLRQLAIHATICQGSTDDHLVLQLNQSTKHLQSETAHNQLEQAISSLLQRNITVEINVVAETIADPYQIQTDINNKRYEYVKALLKEDKVVLHLQEHFQAQLNEESIVVK